MDEADTLADRIGILSEGKLRCCGRSLFLKNRYGAGYVLTMARKRADVVASSHHRHDGHHSRVEDLYGDSNEEKEEGGGDETSTDNVDKEGLNNDQKEDSTVVTSNGDDTQVQRVQSLVTSVIPSATLSSAIAGELVFNLPLSTAPAFSQLFEALNMHASALQVGGYGISITTLEQVFIQLASETERHGSVRSIVGNDEDEGDEHDNEEEEVGGEGGSASQSWWSIVPSMFRRHSKGAIEPSLHTGPSGHDGQGSYHNVHLTSTPSGNGDGDKAEGMLIEGEGGIEMTDMSATPPATEEESKCLGDKDSENGDDTASYHYEDGQRYRVITAEKVAPVSLEKHRLDDNNDDEDHHTNRRHKSHATRGEDDDGYAEVKIYTQLVELLRKRYIIASRDLKGLFFTVIFPTLQIFFILSILMISYSPAGRTIRLETRTLEKALAGTAPGTMFANTNTTLLQEPFMDIGSIQYIDGEAALAALLTDQSDDGNGDDDEASVYDLTGIDNSNDMSEFLLASSLLGRQQFNYHDRYGAVYVNDQVQANISVNWGWVRGNLDTILDNQALLLSIAQGSLGTGSVSASPSGEIIYYNEPVEIDFTLPNVTGLVDDSTINSTLDTIFDVVFTNNTALQTNITELLLDSDTTEGAEGTLSSDRLYYNVSSGVVTLVDASLTVENNFNTSVDLGNTSIPVKTLLNATLPYDVQAYSIGIPSPYTVSYNTSSSHNIGKRTSALLLSITTG